jgi:hypothetical protein
MSINEGGLDRLLRIIVGLVLLVMTPQIGGMIGSPLGAPLGNIAWIGIVPLFTGLIGWCPAYSIIGVKTCSRCKD